MKGWDFMEKVKLNELEYPAKEFMQSGENLSFAVCDISNYAEFRSVLTDRKSVV